MDPRDLLYQKEGLEFASMRALVRLGRSVGKVHLCRYRGRWVLLLYKPGRTGYGFYLQSEKSRSVRLFASAETAIRVAMRMDVDGVWVKRFPVDDGGRDVA